MLFFTEILAYIHFIHIDDEIDFKHLLVAQFNLHQRFLDLIQREIDHATRIVDRYLEHGRIFVFENNGNPEVFMGSADWMNRNIYSRIEVYFPVYNQD